VHETSASALTGTKCIHTEPAKLQGAHKEAGHNQRTCRAESRSADDIERQARAHSRGFQGRVKTGMTNQCTHDDAEERSPSPPHGQPIPDMEVPERRTKGKCLRKSERLFCTKAHDYA
jgi:hypothetical protein